MPVAVRASRGNRQQVPASPQVRQGAYPLPASQNGRVAVGFLFVLGLVLLGCRPSPSTVSVPDSSTLQPSPTTLVAINQASPQATASISSATGQDTGPTEGGRPVAARVNGVPIYSEAFERQVDQTQQALGEQGLLLEAEEGQTQLKQIRQNVLNALVEQAIIEQAAAEAGVVISDAEVETSVQESIALGQGQESFERWLAENDLTMQEFRDTQRSQLLAGKMIEQVTVRIPTTAEQVHARHILVSDATQAQILLEGLQAGANFAALAQEASEDASTAANGGDLGWFPRDVPLMPPEVVDAAFELNAGDISDVIESDQGYHLIKVEAREQNRPLTPEILLYIRQKAFDEWLGEQRDRANIEIYAAMESSS